jgi:hypothetical protein
MYPFTFIQAKPTHASVLKKIKKGLYQESLASHRLAFCKPVKKEKKVLQVPSIIQLDKTKELESLLLKRKMAYERTKSLKGFTIQVYMGKSRTAALQAQEKVSILQSTYVPELNYRQPNYTVRLGFFSNRLEAYIVYLTLVKKLPSAMIRPFTVTRKAYEV